MLDEGVEVEILTAGRHPDFLDLPWGEPLEHWEHERLTRAAHGISRHVVRFVRYGERLYALKETVVARAEAEHHVLRSLRDDGLPVVEPVGFVRTRDRHGPGVLITRYLDFSLPYWYLIGRDDQASRRTLLDAAVVLLVRLHLGGVYWGDCSLSNVLFRRDAGAMMAYLVDAETAEKRPSISDATREHDVEIAVENVAGGILDLQAAGRVAHEVDALEIAEQLRQRYVELWEELTRTERFDAAERWRIDARIRRINELGFDVEELSIATTAGGRVLQFRPTVVEEGHHARELRRRTGLAVQENQARRLLADIENFRARLERDEQRPVPGAVGAARWLAEVFEPAIRAVPADLRRRLEPAEIFHQLLEHRYLMAERLGHDISNAEALVDYLGTILEGRPDEQQLLDEPWPPT